MQSTCISSQYHMKHIAVRMIQFILPDNAARSFCVQEMTFSRYKMPHIIDNTENNNFQKSKASSERDTGWVTPEIPRGFFTTTNRVQYSPEEDFSRKKRSKMTMMSHSSGRALTDGMMKMMTIISTSSLRLDSMSEQTMMVQLNTMLQQMMIMIMIMCRRSKIFKPIH